MKIKFYILFFLLCYQYLLFSQKDGDSLVLFSELKYHSEFEKEAIQSYVQSNSDTLNLFLAIDSSMTEELAIKYNALYRTMISELLVKKIDSKKIIKRVRKSFTMLHNKYLEKYNEIEFLPTLFQKGTYNCVTSSILYSMVFEELKIPYKVQATRNHVYLIANPGPQSIVVETTNPKMDKPENNNYYKKEYVSHLRSIKLVSDLEFKTKSVDEIFEEKMNKVWPAKFDNLAGFQYYNLGLVKFSSKEVEKSYELFQKAYFFYPEKQVQQVLYGVLLQLVSHCKYENVSDIDYLVQLSRYKEISFELTKELFLDILEYHQQFTDRQALCDALYERFLDQIQDESNRNDLSFAFQLQMSKYYEKKAQQKKYIEKLLAHRQNHKETNELFINYLNNSLQSISEYKDLLDTINILKQKYPYDFVQKVLFEHELKAHLDQAYDLLKYNYIEDGESYLNKFENLASEPIETENNELIKSIENAYRALAVYYFYWENRKKALAAINRGLNYVPGSRYLQSAVY